jgi:phage gp29-like protein
MGLFRRTADALTRRFTPRTEARGGKLDFGEPTRARGGGVGVIPTLGSPGGLEFTDLIVGQASKWDVPTTRAAIDSHDAGYFNASALLCDFMFRDDRVASALNTRVLGLQGLPFEIQASDENNRRARKVADALREDWGWICPPSVLEELLQWEAMMGFALAEIIWDTSGERWVPTLKLWHPQYIYYRLDLRKYVAIAQEGVIYIEPGDGKWLLYSRHGYYRSWIRGAVRSLFTPVLARMYTWRDWGRFNEVYGLPIKQAIVPASATDSDKRRFFQQIAQLGSTGAILAPQGSDGQKFGLELVSVAAKANWETFEATLKRGDASINLVLLGQNMSGGEIEGGSFAAAKVADGVRDDYKQADAVSLAACLYTQAVRPWTIFNFGDDAETLAPKPFWDAAPREDQAKTATTMLTVANALQVLTQLGAKVDMDAVVDRFNLPVQPAPLVPPMPLEPTPPNDDTTNEAA